MPAWQQEAVSAALDNQRHKRQDWNVSQPRSGFSAFDDVVQCTSQGEARQVALTSPHRIAIVRREVARAAVFCCPCGCGDVVSINLDPRSGRAWRLIERPHVASLLPSVWLTTGCQSHFFIWRNEVWWCGSSWDDEVVDVDEIDFQTWLVSARSDTASRRR